MSRYYEASDVGAYVPAQHAAPKPPHISSSKAYEGHAKAAVAPSSWGIGTFHQNNPSFNARTAVAVEAGGVAGAHARGTSSRQAVSENDYSTIFELSV